MRMLTFSDDVFGSKIELSLNKRLTCRIAARTGSTSSSALGVGSKPVEVRASNGS